MFVLRDLEHIRLVLENSIQKMETTMETRFDIIGRLYEEALRLYPDARTDGQRMLELLDLQGHEHVLEVTAGSGFLTLQIAACLLKGKVTAQDISGTMLGLSMVKALKHTPCNIL